MKTSTRLIFSVYVVLVILLCLFLLFSVFEVISSDYLILTAKTMLYGAMEYKVLYIAVFCAFIIVGIFLLFFSKKYSHRSVLLKTLDNGKILISYDTILQLSQNYIRSCESISEDHIYIRINKNHVEMSISINVDANCNIPDISSSLHDGLINYINAHTGIEICNCKIIVSKLKNYVHVIK